MKIIRYNVNVVQKRGEKNELYKKKREQAGVTQEQLASELNIDRSTVAKWETTDVLPRADKLPEIAKILGCTVDDLFSADKTA